MGVTIGGILSRLFATVKGRFGALMGLWVVFVAASIGVGMVLSLVMGVGMIAGGGILAGADPGEGGLMAMGMGVIAMMVVMYLVYVVVYLASYAALAHMASPLLQPSFGDSLSAGVRAALPLLGATLLLGIGYLVMFGALGAIGAVAGADGGPIGAIVLLLFLPVSIYLACRLSILLPVAAVDGVRNPVTIITRSWRLTRGHVLSILGATLAYVLIAVVLIVVAFLPVMALFGADAMGSDALGIGAILYLFLAMIVVFVVITITGAGLGSAIHAGVSDAAGETLQETFR